MRYQMEDDTGATGGPRGPVMGGRSRFRGGFGSGIWGQGQGWGRGQGQGQGRGHGALRGKAEDKECSQSPSWAAWLRTWRPSPWMRSSSSPCPSRNLRLLTFSWGNFHKDEVSEIMPVRRQTRAGQRTWFKAFVATGDYNGHTGLGVKYSKEIATVSYPSWQFYEDSNQCWHVCWNLQWASWLPSGYRVGTRSETWGWTDGEGQWSFEQRFPALPGKTGHKGDLSSRPLVSIALILCVKNCPSYYRIKTGKKIILNSFTINITSLRLQVRAILSRKLNTLSALS